MLRVEKVVENYSRKDRPRSWSNIELSLKLPSFIAAVATPKLRKSKSNVGDKEKLSKTNSCPNKSTANKEEDVRCSEEVSVGRRSKKMPVAYSPVNIVINEDRDLMTRLASNNKKSKDPRARVKAQRSASMPEYLVSPISMSELLLRRCQSGLWEHKFLAEHQKYEEHHSFSNRKLEGIISDVLRENISAISYDPNHSISRCRHISQTLETVVKREIVSKKAYKVVAQVFIGELSVNEICFATQCTYRPVEDYFASSTWQTEDLFVCAIVYAGRIIETNNTTVEERRKMRDTRV